MVAGKYGIGLLGFWSIGHRMDIRSRVGGGEVWVLRMVEDQERAELVRDRMAFETAETFTEVVIGELHDSAQRLLTGRRLNDYLASELRGMLLATGAGLEIHDGLARGLAERTFTVVPRRFVGERLALPEAAPVEGYPPARIELYLARGDDRAAVEVSCAGTLVADDAAELRARGAGSLALDRAGVSPASSSSPRFQIPPGTRRGIVPDAGVRGVRARHGRLRAAGGGGARPFRARAAGDHQPADAHRASAGVARPARPAAAVRAAESRGAAPASEGTTPVAGSGAVPEGLPLGG